MSVEEIRDVEKSVIKSAQIYSFKEKYDALAAKKPIPNRSKPLPLNPRLDEDGLMRSEGRLIYAEYLLYDVRYMYSVILQRKSWVTKLIVRWYHQQGNNAAGTNRTLAMLSSRFWVMQGRGEIWDCEGECFECRRSQSHHSRLWHPCQT